MRSIFFLAATLLASPLVSASGRTVLVDEKRWQRLQRDFYDLAITARPSDGGRYPIQNGGQYLQNDPSALYGPRSCSKNDQNKGLGCNNFVDYTNCWQVCVASQSTRNVLSQNCDDFCVNTCGCDKSQDSYQSGFTTSTTSTTSTITTAIPTSIFY